MAAPAAAAAARAGLAGLANRGPLARAALWALLALLGLLALALGLMGLVAGVGGGLSPAGLPAGARPFLRIYEDAARATSGSSWSPSASSYPISRASTARR